MTEVVVSKFLEAVDHKFVQFARYVKLSCFNEISYIDEMGAAFPSGTFVV